MTAQQVQFSRFDAVDYLDGDEAIEAYLQAVREGTTLTCWLRLWKT